ncbi:hypothetical protein M0811_07724 [Anaeramoeba ignava]|uniref:Carrier domain-containing protein n=1 Tax=Anaeramoeba ignava TaxID=1746090 RepID=A0A9Q0LPR0_ANAIG|nr:hypothetical protein M0811_07724 [Anaeramoeba ignava]
MLQSKSKDEKKTFPCKILVVFDHGFVTEKMKNFELILRHHDPKLQLKTNTQFNLSLNIDSKSETSAQKRKTNPFYSKQYFVQDYFDFVVSFGFEEETNKKIVPNWLFFDRIFYNSEKINQLFVCNFYEHFARIAKTSNKQTAVGSVPEITGKEEAVVVNEWNNISGKNFTKTKKLASLGIPMIFRKITKKRQGAIAIRSKNAKVTYEQLEYRSDLFAVYLQKELKIRSNTVIGVSMKNSVETIVALLGIIKAGCSYIALRPEFSANLLARIIRKLDVKHVLSGAASAGVFEKLKKESKTEINTHLITVNELESILKQVQRSEVRKTKFKVKGNQVAIVFPRFSDDGKLQFFTLTHANIITKFITIQSSINLCNVVGFCSPIYHEQSLIELWGTLINGGRIVVFYMKNLLSSKFEAFIRQSGTKVLTLSTSVFQQIVSRDSTFIRQQQQPSIEHTDPQTQKSTWPFHLFDLLMIYGEPIAYRKFFEFVKTEKMSLPKKLVYCFGTPQTASIFALLPVWDEFQWTGRKEVVSENEDDVKDEKQLPVFIPNIHYWIHKYKSSTGFLPIGTPCSDCEVYVLNSKTLKPVPFGVSGEVYVSCLSIGTLLDYNGNEDEKTDKFRAQFDRIFVPNPFEKSDSENKLLFNTGIHGCILSSGKLEFYEYQQPQEIRQVFVNSEFVNVKAIEEVIKKHSKVKQAVVLVRDAENSERKRIVAYLVCEETIPPSFQELSQFIQNRLPQSHVPVSYVFVEKTQFGSDKTEISRAMLLAKYAHAQEKTSSTTDTTVTRNANQSAQFKPPSNPTEEFLCKTFASVLNYEQVGASDNFFALGGDSISATRIVAKALHAGLRFSTEDLFLNPVVSDLAVFIEKQKEKFQQNIDFSAHHRRFFEQQLPEPSQSERLVFINLDHSVNLKYLKKAFLMILAQHENLRLVFPENHPHLQSLEDLTHKKSKRHHKDSSVFSVLKLPTSEMEPKQIGKQCAKIQQSLRIAKGPLIKFVVFVEDQTQDTEAEKLNNEDAFSIFHVEQKQSQQEKTEKDFSKDHFLAMILIHNLLVDTESIKKLVSQLQTNYETVRSSFENFVEIPAPSPVTEYYHYLNSQKKLEITKKSYTFWQTISNRKKNYVKPVPKNISEAGTNFYEDLTNIRVSFDDKTSHLIYSEIARKDEYQMADILVTGIGLALTDWTSSIYNFIHLIEPPNPHSQKTHGFIAPVENTIPVLIAFTQPNVVKDNIKSFELVKKQLREFRLHVQQLNKILYYNDAQNANESEDLDYKMEFEKQTQNEKQIQSPSQQRKSSQSEKQKEILTSGLGAEIPDANLNLFKSDEDDDDEQTGMRQDAPDSSEDEDISFLKVPQSKQEELKILSQAEIAIRFIGNVDFNSFSLGKVSIDPLTEPKKSRKLNSPKAQNPYLIEIISFVQQGCVSFKLIYNKKLFKAETIKSLARNMMKILIKLSKDIRKENQHKSKSKSKKTENETQEENDIFANFPLAKSLTVSVIRELFEEDSLIEEILTPSQFHQETIRFFLRKDQLSKSHIASQLLLRFTASEFDENKLRQACQIFVDQHPAMRSYFVRNQSKQSNILHIIRKKAEIPFRFMKFEQMDDTFKQEIAQERQHPFKFSHAPLIRFSLFSIEKDSLYLLSIAFESFLLDFWSIPLMIQEIFSKYCELASNSTDDKKDLLPTLPHPQQISLHQNLHKEYISYEHNLSLSKSRRFYRSFMKDFDINTPIIPTKEGVSNFQQLLLNQENIGELKSRSKSPNLSNMQHSRSNENVPISPKLDRSQIPAKKITPSDIDIKGQFFVNTAEFKEINAHVGADSLTKIISSLRTNNLTLNSFIHFIWALTLNFVNPKTPTYFGTTISGRPAELGEVADKIVAMMSRVLPIKFELYKDKTILAHIAQIQSLLLKSSLNPHVTDSRIRKWCKFPKKTYLYNGGVVVFEGYPKDRIFPLRDLGDENYEVVLDLSKLNPSLDIMFSNLSVMESLRHPLSLIVFPSGQDLLVRIVYNQALFEERTINRLIDLFTQFFKLISSSFTNLDKPIKDLLSKSESSDFIQKSQDKSLKKDKSSPQIDQSPSPLSKESDNLDQDHIFKQGYLTKKGGHGFTANWRKRWFILKNDQCFYYYKSQGTAQPSGLIPMKGASIEPLPNHKKKNCFQIKTEYRSYPIYAESKQIMDSWIDEITKYLARINKN